MVHGHVGELETQNNSNGQNSLSPIFVKHTVKDRSAQQTRQTVGSGEVCFCVCMKDMRDV